MTTTKRRKHPFAPGRDPLVCAVCGMPRFTQPKGKDAYHLPGKRGEYR